MIRWAIKRWMENEARAVLRSAAEPEATQRTTFRRLHRILGHTEMSRRSGFARCATLEDCRELPLCEAGSLKPWVDELLQRGNAARAFFGPSRLAAFARTSGTVEAKMLPLNASYFASYDRSLARMTACRFHATGEWETLLAGSYVNLGSRAHVATAPCGLPIGDISGLLPTRVPWLHRRFCLPRPEDQYLAEWPEKVTRLIEQAGRERVHTICGVPALAFDFARRAKARYGVATLTEIWPQLRWFVYGGYSLSPDEKQAVEREWCGGTGRLHCVEGYLATEGALGFSVNPAEPGLVLNTLEHLFLFLPLTGGAPCFAHEVEAGTTYALAITTPGGLINYRVGDLVRIESSAPLRVRVVGREREEISLTGEHISLAQIDAALAKAGFSGRSSDTWTVVWPADDPVPHLCWGWPATTDAPEPAQLDRALADLNPLYAEALFCEGVVGPSQVVPIPAAVYERHRARRLGIGQFKPKRIFPSACEFLATYDLSPRDIPPLANAVSPSAGNSVAI